jgi:protein-S-isoprenylcysteine O-methyltransferase
MANLFSLTEHIVTLYLFDFSFKVSLLLIQRQHCLMPVALSVSVVGELLRIAAFFTCRSNFTHVVKSRIDGAHRLITKGVYSFFRHPSYTGYFYFSVFGQIFIGNFISSVLFFVVLSRFFNDRIEFEEEALLRSFPEYLAYKEKTYILIPFVRDPDFAKKYSVEKEEEAELSDSQS